MKKNFKITGFPAFVFLCIWFFIQCLFMCGVVKLLTLILHIDFNLELTVTTFVVCKTFQIIGYFCGVRWK
jgi:hypothetical protein